MGKFPFEEFDTQFAAAREKLRHAYDNPTYQMYAAAQGPLPLSDVNTEFSYGLEETVEQYGWPDEVDKLIRPPGLYATDVDFMRSLQQGGTREIGANTILNTLGSPLVKSFSEVRSGIDVNGVLPYLHRAYAVAPDLMDGVREVIVVMRERYHHFKAPSTGDVISALAQVAAGDDILRLTEDPLLDAYLSPENADLCQALYLAYRVTSRLIKVDDFSRIQGKRAEGDTHYAIDAYRVMMGWWD